MLCLAFIPCLERYLVCLPKLTNRKLAWRVQLAHERRILHYKHHHRWRLHAPACESLLVIVRERVPVICGELGIVWWIEEHEVVCIWRVASKERFEVLVAYDPMTVSASNFSTSAESACRIFTPKFFRLYEIPPYGTLNFPSLLYLNMDE